MLRQEEPVKSLNIRIEPTPSEICIKCENKCCRIGGASCTSTEHTAIVDAGYDDHFTEISEGIYHTVVSNDGICPYLTSEGCSIYAVRPLGCRLFPIAEIPHHGILLIHCPLAKYLSESEIKRSLELLSSRPRIIIEVSRQYLDSMKVDSSMILGQFEFEMLVGFNTKTDC